MANIKAKRGTIGILTGGGDVPGLNPAIRAVTLRALNEGYKVIGLKRGWGGLIELVRDKEADNSANYCLLTEEYVRKAGRTGGTFLHTSRTRPSHVPLSAVPTHLRDTYTEKSNDLTPDVLKNLEFLGIDTLVPIGGDDTLSYGVHLHQQGFKVVAIPKTMDNDVPGTDYCIGFSTCVTRTIALSHALRTSAGSHERFLVIEVFGRYAGFTALLPTLAAAADRCLIPEHPFDFDRLTELMCQDRAENPSHYAIVIVSEGAVPEGGDMVFCDQETDMFGHKKLGGIGDLVAQRLKELSPKYNNGRKVDVLNQKLGYLVRCGEPDALDYIIPMAFGNIAFDLILEGKSGRMACLRKGEYDDVPLDVVTSKKKVVDIDTSYDRDRLRPLYSHFGRKPFLLIEGA